VNPERSKAYRDANRLAWDAAEPGHREARFLKLLEAFRTPGYNYLDGIATRVLTERIGLAGKSVVQLACNNGREILSVRNLGAGRCAGFDISAKFIAEGHELAAAGKIECELAASDVYEIPRTFDGQFDVAFVSVGALILMPHLDTFFSVPARLLRPGGTLFLYERHPLLDMFDWRGEAEPPPFAQSYFRTEPFEFKQVINYWTREEYETPPMYVFHHKLADVFNGVIGAGFRVDWFEEYPHDISEVYAHFSRLRFPMPLSYALTATRG